MALRPVGPVAVAHQQRDGRAQRFAVADAGEHLGAVALDAHAPAAPVAALPAAELAVDLVRVKSGRPAGSPSTTATSAGPCDSPAVVKRKVGMRRKIARECERRKCGGKCGSARVRKWGSAASPVHEVARDERADRGSGRARLSSGGERRAAHSRATLSGALRIRLSGEARFIRVEPFAGRAVAEHRIGRRGTHAWQRVRYGRRS